jgi:hypothetical protein
MRRSRKELILAIVDLATDCNESDETLLGTALATVASLTVLPFQVKRKLMNAFSMIVELLVREKDPDPIDKLLN